MTLGKRIKFHRQRLHLTQEQLAERVGVSPQAVSKWENDISCPDISILPELAKIFGISVDELMGVEQERKTYEAEVVPPDEKHTASWNWQNESRRGGICFAVYLLCVGALLLVNNLAGLGVSWWSVVWMTALLVLGLGGLSRSFSFFSLGLALGGAYLLLSEFSVIQWKLGWNVIVPTFLVLWGVSLLVDGLRKKHRRPQMAFSSEKPPRMEYRCDEGMLDCELSFGGERVVVAEPLLRGGRIESSFGDFVMDFSGVGAVAEGCTVCVENSFGSLALLIPERFAASVRQRDCTAASVNVKGQPAAPPEGVIALQCDLSFGTVEIRYVS